MNSKMFLGDFEEKIPKETTEEWLFPMVNWQEV